MLASNSTPRVNFEQLERFPNRSVLLVAQVDSVEGSKAKVKAADGGHVYVELTGPPAFNTPFVQFQGIVTSATSLREESRTDFGNIFDMQTYNELCKLSTMDHADIF